MNTDFEKVPAVIFDWIKTKSFEDLTHSQKKDVLTYLSEEKYKEMYLAYLRIKPVSGSGNFVQELQSKNILLKHFDKRYPKEKNAGNGSSQKTLLFWQAAAVFLMLLSGALFYNFMDLKKSLSSQPVASADTVYVTKEITTGTSVVYDTIYKYIESYSNAGSTTHVEEVIFENEDLQPLNDGGYQPSIDLDNIDIRPRGSSMKDDSLLRKFGFVSM